MYFIYINYVGYKYSIKYIYIVKKKERIFFK